MNFKRGTLNTSGSEVSGTPGEAQRWTLDALGNWEEFEKDEDGSTVSEESRQHRIDNALTAIGSTSLTYDGPGNLKDDGTYLYDYDGENRLTRVRSVGVPPALIAEYAYNALGWRVKKAVSNSGDLNGTFRMIYNQSWQLLEIRTVSGGSTAVAKQFVHAGPGVNSPALALGVRSSLAYIDDHVSMLTPDGSGWLTHYYHTDALFNTLALTCGTGDPAGGQVAERSQFEPYGAAALTDAGDEPIASSAIGNPFQRQGIARDWETGNDENRHRWYGPEIGRWAQRDPLFAVGYQATTGNVQVQFWSTDTGYPVGSAVTTPDLQQPTCDLKYQHELLEWGGDAPENVPFPRQARLATSSSSEPPVALVALQPEMPLIVGGAQLACCIQLQRARIKVSWEIQWRSRILRGSGHVRFGHPVGGGARGVLRSRIRLAQLGGGNSVQLLPTTMPVETL